MVLAATGCQSAFFFSDPGYLSIFFFPPLLFLRVHDPSFPPFFRNWSRAPPFIKLTLLAIFHPMFPSSGTASIVLIFFADPLIAVLSSSPPHILDYGVLPGVFTFYCAGLLSARIVLPAPQKQTPVSPKWVCRKLCSLLNF